MITKRPWGKFERFTLNKKSTVKILDIKPKKRLSLQLHNKRKEFWKILEGNALITIGNKEIKAKPGDEFTIPKKTKHRAKSYSKPLKILEISFGTFSEKDEIRLEDDYTR